MTRSHASTLREKCLVFVIIITYYYNYDYYCYNNNNSKSYFLWLSQNITIKL